LNPFSVDDFVINYILLPVFVGFVVGWKVWHKTKFVKLEEMDIWTGRRERVYEEDEDNADGGRGSGAAFGAEARAGTGWRKGNGWRARVWRGVVG